MVTVSPKFINSLVEKVQTWDRGYGRAPIAVENEKAYPLGANKPGG